VTTTQVDSRGPRVAVAAVEVPGRRSDQPLASCNMLKRDHRPDVVPGWSVGSLFCVASLQLDDEGDLAGERDRTRTSGTREASQARR